MASRYLVATYNGDQRRQEPDGDGCSGAQSIGGVAEIRGAGGNTRRPGRREHAQLVASETWLSDSATSSYCVVASHCLNWNAYICD